MDDETVQAMMHDLEEIDRDLRYKVTGVGADGKKSVLMINAPWGVAIAAVALRRDGAFAEILVARESRRHAAPACLLRMSHGREWR
jgi:hypothetical protein